LQAELHLALRYLGGLVPRSLGGTGRHTHVATVTAISLLGLCLGVIALIVTLALLEGFQSSIRRELEERATHARLRPLEGRRLADPQRLASELQAQLGDVEMVQVVRGTCLVSSGSDAVPASVVGRSDAEQVVMDHILAARLGVGPGEAVQVISPRQRLTPMGPLPVRVRVEVAEVSSPEPGSETGAVRLPLDQAQRLLWGDAVVEVIELRDPRDPWRLGKRIRSTAAVRQAEVAVDGLAELHRPLLVALALERIVIFLAVGLMLVVAAFNLLCNVAMVAAEKRRDLAVLAGLGLAPAAMRRLFLLLGLGIGVVGSTVGAVLGVGAAVFLDHYQLLRLPRGVFVVSSVPFKVQPLSVVLVLVVALCCAAAMSWFPARVVARREPAEGLRYE
jgi:lipoprotein-releasing system permease protein